jgi:hypothetical protein
MKLGTLMPDGERRKPIDINVIFFVTDCIIIDD